MIIVQVSAPTTHTSTQVNILATSLLRLLLLIAGGRVVARRAALLLHVAIAVGHLGNWRLGLLRGRAALPRRRLGARARAATCGGRAIAIARPTPRPAALAVARRRPPAASARTRSRDTFTRKYYSKRVQIYTNKEYKEASD